MAAVRMVPRQNLPPPVRGVNGGESDVRLDGHHDTSRATSAILRVTDQGGRRVEAVRGARRRLKASNIDGGCLVLLDQDHISIRGRQVLSGRRPRRSVHRMDGEGAPPSLDAARIAVPVRLI